MFNAKPLLLVVALAAPGASPKITADGSLTELVKACDAGETTACRAACDAGDGHSCYALAQTHLESGAIRYDRALAVQFHERGCELGEAKACHQLGLIYRTESQGLLDLPRAITLLERACQLGAPPACNDLGWMAHGAWGMPKDLAKATALFSKACDRDSPDGCNHSARMHWNGEGVPRDPDRARELFERACALGHAGACAFLGSQYEYGWDTRGTDRNHERASVYYRQACDRGHAQSCETLDALACDAAGGVILRDPLLAHFVSSLSIDPCRPANVLRIELDVTGDGKPEVFLGSNQLAGNAGTSWIVYTPKGRGRYRVFAETFFHFLAFRYEPRKSLWVAYHRSGAAQGTFGYFKIGSKGFHLLRNEDVETHTGRFKAEWEQIVKWRTTVRPPMGWADLRQLNANPDIVWRDLTTDEPEARLAKLVGVVVGPARPGK